MAKNKRWVLVLAIRVFIDAAFGAFFCELVGVELVAAPMNLAVYRISGVRALELFVNGHILSGDIIFAAMEVAAVINGLVGMITLGVLGFLRPPHRTYLPPTRTLGGAILGMGIGWLGAATSLTLLVVLESWSRYGNAAVAGDLFLTNAFFTVPGVMACGLVAGAIRGFRAEKKHASE